MRQSSHERLRAVLGDTAFEVAYHDGWNLSDDAIVAIALTDST